MAGWVSPLDFIDEQNWPVPQAPAPQSNWFMAGAKAGLHDVASNTGATAQWAGKLTGISPLENAGRSLSDSESAAADANRPDLNTPPWREGGAPVLPWLGYQALRNAPYIAATALASRFVPAGMVPGVLKRAGAYVPEFFGGGGARMGAEAGAEAFAKGADFAHTMTAGATAGAPMAIGQMQQQVNERVDNGGDPYTWGEAASIGAKALPYSALESVGPASLFGIAKQLKTAKTATDLGKIALKGMAAGAIEEAPQEAIQTAMEQAHRSDLSVSDKAQNIIDGALTGAAVGGVFGGVSGGVSGTRSMLRSTAPVEASTDEIAASTIEVDPEAKAAAEAAVAEEAAPPPAETAPAPVEEEAPAADPTTVSNEPKAEEPALSPYEYLIGSSGFSPKRTARFNFITEFDKKDAERIKNATPEELDAHTLAYAKAWDKATPANQNMMRATGLVDGKGRTAEMINAEIEQIKQQQITNPGLRKSKGYERKLDALNTSLEEMNAARAKWQSVVEAYAKQKGTTNGLSSETSRADAGPDVSSVVDGPSGQESAVPTEGRQGQQGQQAPGEGQGESAPVRKGRQPKGRVQEAAVEGSVLPADAWGDGVGEKVDLDTSTKPVTLEEMFAPENTPSKSTFSVAGEVDARPAPKSENIAKLAKMFEGGIGPQPTTKAEATPTEEAPELGEARKLTTTPLADLVDAKLETLTGAERTQFKNGVRAGSSEKAYGLPEKATDAHKAGYAFARQYRDAQALIKNSEKKPLIGKTEAMTAQDHALAEHITQGKPAAHIFDVIAEDTSRPEYKSFAQALKRLKVNPTIEFSNEPTGLDPFVRKGESIKGTYDLASNRIRVYQGDNLHRTVLHEAAHAATVRAIQYNTVAAQQLKDLMETARKALGFSAADRKTINTEEFIAEAYTNPEFRQQMRELYPTGSKLSMWDRFKNFVAKLLRLPTSAKTLLDEVMDAGDRLMEKNAQIDPEARQHFISTVMSRPFGLIEEDKKPAQAVTLARRALDAVWQTIDPHGGLTARLAVQRQLLKGSSWGHIAEHFDHLFNKEDPSKGPLHKLDRGQTFRNSFKAHLGDLFRDAMTKWTMAHPRAKEIIGHFAYLSSLRVNPKLKADAHKWLSPEEHARLDEKIIPEANRMYAELKGIKGGVEAYEAAIAHNEIQEFAAVAMQLYDQMRRSELYSPLMGKFPAAPEDEFAQLPSLHNNIIDARQFWFDKMTELEQAVADANKKVDELIGKMPRNEQTKAENSKKAMKDAVDAVHQKKTAASQFPYFHLMRDGDSFVAFKLKRVGKNGPIDPASLAKVNEAFDKYNVYINAEQDQDQVFMRFQTEQDAIDAHAAALKLANEGYLATEEDGEDGKKVNVRPTHGYRSDAPPSYILTNQQVRQAVDAMRAAYSAPDDATEEMKKLAQAIQNHAVNEFRNYLVDMMPDMALAKVNIKRENKPGFSKDMERAFARRAHIGVNALSSMAASRKIEDALQEMKDSLRSSKEDGKNPTDVFVKQNIYREAMLRQLDHAKASDVDGDLVDVGRAVNSFWHLAFSPSYALINSAQVFVLLWPELSKHMGYMKAGKAIMKVMPEAARILGEAIKAGYDVKAIMDPNSDARTRLAALGHSILRSSDAGITLSVLEKAYGIDTAKGKTLQPREQEILAAALRGGIDLNSASRELARVSEGLSDKSIDALFRVGASMGQYSETFTRLTAALAAYDVYKSDEKIGKVTKKSLPDYIDHVIKQSMLDYAETNTARGIGRHGWAGNLSPLMFSFMNYQFQVLEKLYREMHTAIGLQKDFDPEQQKAAQKFLLGHAIALTTLTGTLGLPAAGFLAGMVNRLKEAFGDDKDVRENYREFLASVFGQEVGEVLAHGLPHAAGFSISKRAGEQDIIPFTELLASRQKFVDATKDWAFSMGGAPLNAIANLIAGSHEFANGKYLDGARTALPVFVKGPLAAYQMATEGYVDKKGNKLPMSADAQDILYQLLGVLPSEKAEYQEQRKFMADRKGLEMARGSNIRNQIASAIESGDQEAARKWFEEANAFAQQAPDRDIRPSIGSAVSRRAKDRAMAQFTHSPLGLSPRTGGMVGQWAGWGD